MYAYNPRKKSAEQLESSLVGADRHAILNDIMAELTLKEGESPKQHWMIVGARGMGKSHLLTLLHHKVCADDTLRDLWLPVLFPEEIRMAGDLARFLERALTEVGHDLEKLKSPATAELKEKLARIRTIRPDERVDYLFSVITWVRRATGRHILLIAENLQQLLGKRISLIDQKKLRAYLQSEDALLFIGSATTIFDALHDHSHPFYHFFHIRRLSELSYEDIRTLVMNLLAGYGKEEQPRLIMENEARLKVLYAFTGGNPRMAVFLADILKTDVNEEMIEIMDRILDELTPYFEAIINDTPEYLQEIINALAAFEPAQSPMEIAGHLEMEPATVRNYMKQAKDNGYVRVAFSKGKSNYYCLNEYLYRTWFQMRDSSHREEMRWMMELMLLLYSREQLLKENTSIAENGEVVGLYQRLVRQTCEFMLANPSFCNVVDLCAKQVGLPGTKRKRTRKGEFGNIPLDEAFKRIEELDAARLSRRDYLEGFTKILVDALSEVVDGKLGQLLSYSFNIQRSFITSLDIKTAINEYNNYIVPLIFNDHDLLSNFVNLSTDNNDIIDILTLMNVALEDYDKAIELVASVKPDSEMFFINQAIALLIVQTIYYCSKENSDAMLRSCDALVAISRLRGREKGKLPLLPALLLTYRSGAIKYDMFIKLFTYAKENHPKDLALLALWPCFESPESVAAQRLMTNPAAAKLVEQVNNLITTVTDKLDESESG